MNIAVFCGSGTGNKPAYQDKARELGLWIAENRHTLIFGGGNAGLMGIVARAAFENGGSCEVLPLGKIASRLWSLTEDGNAQKAGGENV